MTSRREELIGQFMNQAGFSQERYDGKVKPLKEIQANDWVITGRPNNDTGDMEMFWGRIIDIRDNSYSFIYADGKEYWVSFDPQDEVLIIRERKN